MNTPPAKSICPLCGGSNDCAMTQVGGAQPECWCMQVKIGADVLARVSRPEVPGPDVPNLSGSAACICARCAAGQTPQR